MIYAHHSGKFEKAPGTRIESNMFKTRMEIRIAKHCPFDHLNEPVPALYCCETAGGMVVPVQAVDDIDPKVPSNMKVCFAFE